MQKFFFFLIALLTIFFSSVWIIKTSHHQSVSFPKALLMPDGNPIHPECVLSTQFGDPSRLDPISIYSKVYQECPEMQISNEVLDVSRIDESIVSLDYEYSIKEIDITYSTHVDYQAWTVTDEIALVLTHHYDLSGTGRFNELGLIKREGDFLVNGGFINAGDRFAGRISIDSFEDEILQYRSTASSRVIMDVICSQLEANYYQGELEDSIINYAGELIWQCNLTDGNIADHRIIGISFYPN